MFHYSNILRNYESIQKKEERKKTTEEVLYLSSKKLSHNLDSESKNKISTSFEKKIKN